MARMHWIDLRDATAVVSVDTRCTLYRPSAPWLIERPDGKMCVIWNEEDMSVVDATADAIFQRFRKLVEATDDEVREFVAICGCLEREASFCLKADGIVRFYDSMRELWKDGVGHEERAELLTAEPLEVYRSLAKQIDGILSVSADLQQNRIPKRLDMAHALKIDVSTVSAWRAEEIPHEFVLETYKSMISTLATLWLNASGVRPVMHWGGEDMARLTLSAGGDGFYGQPGRWPALGKSFAYALADMFDLLRKDRGESSHTGSTPMYTLLGLQVVAALTSRRGLYHCGQCGRTFEPKEGRNKPRSDGRPLCHDKDCDAKVHSIAVVESRKRRPRKA